MSFWNETLEKFYTASSKRESGEKSACNSCHKYLGYLAILMDKFDSIGATNHHYNAEKVKVNEKNLPDIEDLKKYLGEYKKPMARAFTRKLISFMMGREVGVQDEAILDAILRATEKDDYRVGDFLYSSGEILSLLRRNP